MKFKNILTEALIDDLNIPPIDKGILKTYHLIKNEKGSWNDNTWELTAGERLYKVANLLAIEDYDKLVRLYNVYQTYGNILFDKSIDENDLYVPLDYTRDESLINAALILYFYNNYDGEVMHCTNVKSIGRDMCWEYKVMEDDPEDAILEESSSLELYLSGEEPIPYVTTFLGYYSSQGNVGFDVIIMNEELLDYNNRMFGRNNEILSSGTIQMNPPKDLKPETLKVYFDTLFKKMSDHLKEEVNWKIENYIEYVQNNQPPR
jgi:hypothetical protein